MALVVSSGLASSCAREADIPDPPDVSPLVLPYESPDGFVDAVSVATTVDVVVPIADRLRASAIAPYLRELVRRTEERAREQVARALARDRLESDRVSIDAVVRLRAVCNGWSGVPTVDEANGAVETTAVVRGNVVEPVVTVRTAGCRHSQLAEGQPLRLWLEGQIALSAAPGQPLFVRIDGAFGNDREVVRGALDFRAREDGIYEIRIGAPGGGTLIFFFGAGVAGVRGVNGSFACDIAARRCTGPDGTPFQW